MTWVSYEIATFTTCHTSALDLCRRYPRCTKAVTSRRDDHRDKVERPRSSSLANGCNRRFAPSSLHKIPPRSAPRSMEIFSSSSVTSRSVLKNYMYQSLFVERFRCWTTKPILIRLSENSQTVQVLANNVEQLCTFSNVLSVVDREMGRTCRRTSLVRTLAN